MGQVGRSVGQVGRWVGHLEVGGAGWKVGGACERWVGQVGRCERCGSHTGRWMV